MKRLQFRHHDEIFDSRSLALEFFRNIIDTSHTASTIFGKSLYAEPMVAKYKDSENNIQLLFAIGVDSPNTPYHIIDSKEIYELIKNNENSIIIENERAIAIEDELRAIINLEIERAKNEETLIKESINVEIERAKESENNILKVIDENKTSLISIQQSSENVLEEYALRNTKGEILGETIKIYKDSSLVGALTGFKGAKNVELKEDGSFELIYDEITRDENIEYLYLIYRNEVGDLKLVGIDFENFLMEAEFGNGFKVIDHIAHLKIKEGEKYLNVDENGLYTSNIDEIINNSILELNNSLTSKINNLEENVNNKFTEVEEEIKTEVNKLDEDFSNKLNNLDSSLSNIINEKEILLKSEIKANKIDSKDVVLTQNENGTILSIQTDEVTITKKADANTLYDTNIAVLGTLLKIKEVPSTKPSIKTRYELQDGNNNLIGDAIELPVESALISVTQGNKGDIINVETGEYMSYGEGEKTINFIYRLDSGNYQLLQIVISDYFTDAHFGKGLKNEDGVISLELGDANEYLVINDSSIEVTGVKLDIEKAKNEAINTAINTSNSYTDSTANNLTSFITSSIETATNTLNESVNLEINRAISSETKLSEDISNLNKNLSSLVSNEIIRVEGKIQNEISERKSEDILIRNEISNTVSTLRDEISNAQIETVKIAVESATTIASQEVAKVVADADTSFDTLKEIADWIINDTTGAASMANDIKRLDAEDKIIKTSIETVNNSIESKAYKCINDSFIINNIPITDVTPNEAFRSGSLLRKVRNNGIEYFYVSNRADEMYYISENETPIVLNDYISNLNNKVNNLNSEISDLNNTIVSLNAEIEKLKNSVNAEQVKEIIKTYLVGFNNEIEVKEVKSTDTEGKEINNLQIRFAEDAIFG